MTRRNLFEIFRRNRGCTFPPATSQLAKVFWFYQCECATQLCMPEISDWPSALGNGIPKTAVIPVPHKTVSREIWPYHQDHKKIHSSYNPPKKNMFQNFCLPQPFSYVSNTSGAIQDMGAEHIFINIYQFKLNQFILWAYQCTLVVAIKSVVWREKTLKLDIY